MKLMCTIAKDHVVCAAHRLMEHPGKCDRLHGHNYRITYHFAAPAGLNPQGMVIDFGDIKGSVMWAVDDLIDHKCILQEGDPLIEHLDPAEVFVMPNSPTAENIGIGLIHAVQDLLDKAGTGIIIVRIDIEETPGASATVFTMGEVHANNSDQ